MIVIYRKDQEFSLKNVIPKKNNGKNSYDLIIASQPYRSRISAEKKVKYVIDPFSSGVGVVNLSLNNQITFYSKWQEIPLFGILFIGFSWLLFHKIWATCLLASLVLLWWLLFLIIVPDLYKKQYK